MKKVGVLKFEAVTYEHAARLSGSSLWDVSRDPNLLAAALQKALDTYHNDICVVGMDLYNVEIEAYGVSILKPADDGLPIAGPPILHSLEDILTLTLNPATDGRMPMMLETADKLARQNPDVDIRIPIAGPFTNACHLVGMETMIFALVSEPDLVQSALRHLAENSLKYVRAALEKNFSFTIFESTAAPPLVSPDLFEAYIHPALKKIIDVVNTDDGADAQLIIGGDAMHLVEALCESGAAYVICPMETDQASFMSRIPSGCDMHVRLNMNPAVFLPDKVEAARQEARRVLGIAEQYDHTSIGAIIPSDGDPKIVHEVIEIVSR